MEQRWSLQQMVLESLDIHMQKTKTKKTQEKDLILFTKINSNRSDPHVKCKTIRLLKDNRGENLDELEYANGF